MVTVQLSALKVKSEHDNELVDALVVSNRKCIDIYKNCSIYLVFWTDSAFGQVLYCLSMGTKFCSIYFSGSKLNFLSWYF